MRRAHVWFLLLILLLGFLLRVYPLEQYHGWDESAYLQHAEKFAFGKDNYDELFYRPPLLSVLLAGGFLLWHNPVMPGILIALLTTSLILAVYLIGSRWSFSAGVWGALITALHPALVTFSHLVLTDVLSATFLAWAFYVAMQKRFAWLAGLLVGCAGLTKFTGLAGIGLVGGWYVLEKDWKGLVQFGSAALVTIAPYFGWVAYTFGSPLATMQHATSLLPNSGPPLSFYFSLAIFTLPLLVGLSCFVLFAQKDKLVRQHQNMLLFSLAWVAFFLAYLTFEHAKVVRYGLLICIPLLWIAGAGYAALTQRFTHQVFLGLLALIIFIVSVQATERLSEPSVHRWVPDGVEVAHYINTLPSQPVYAATLYPVLGYYTNVPVHTVEGPQFDRAYVRLMTEPGYLVFEKGRETPPTVMWLKFHPEFAHLWENTRYAVYRYVPAR